MRCKKRFRLPLVCLLTLAWIWAFPLGAQETTPKAQLPLLNTSAGQSQDVTTLNIICEEAGIMYDYCDVPDVEMLGLGVGLGDREGESRSGFHVEVYTDLDAFPQGTPYKTVIFARRGAPGSDNERMIDAVAPFADYLIVTKDSNKDGRFGEIAKAGNIPLTEVDYALNLVDVLKSVFSGS
jgi:hypothetical protein